ncbi:predicted protein [Histoplasma capsulatum G186AR]|uniref:Uncharacterized protein n=1 Tax=Ajellomyces capsulatus (strain G186AR / H82 / ATCC MYA-2454 / RMSCC 2432) TaxID=447093 RepID=C0NDG4_AJECG|nr:uncharacterized protein HCBG_01160 [Histoplasma capsulatum G186AR]EEH11705.1 predicted protein [Histoplasma capsulatum G186AR]
MYSRCINLRHKYGMPGNPQGTQPESKVQIMSDEKSPPDFAMLHGKDQKNFTALKPKTRYRTPPQPTPNRWLFKMFHGSGEEFWGMSLGPFRNNNVVKSLLTSVRAHVHLGDQPNDGLNDDMKDKTPKRGHVRINNQFIRPQQTVWYSCDKTQS